LSRISRGNHAHDRHPRPPEGLHDAATYEGYLMHRVATGDAEGLASGLFPLEYAATAQEGYRV
jgi:hypothetical protein